MLPGPACGAAGPSRTRVADRRRGPPAPRLAAPARHHLHIRAHAGCSVSGWEGGDASSGNESV